MTAINNSQANQIDQLLKSVEGYKSGDGVTATREQLENLFEDVKYFNGGEEGAKKIQAQIDTLTGTIKTLKKEAEDLQKEIDKKNLKIDNKADKLSEIASQINKDTVEYQQNAKAAAQQAAVTAIQQYKNDPEAHTFEDYFAQSFFKNLTGGPTVQSIKNLYGQYETIKSSVSPIANEIQRLLDETRGLQRKLDNTSATINMLEMTKNNMSESIKGAYKNVDTNSDIPVFSGAKAEVANKLLGKYTSRNATEGDLKATTTKGSDKQKDAAQKEWLALKDAGKATGDKLSAQKNPQLMNLRNLIADGMLTSLQDSGMNVDEIMTFISSNWDVGISKNNGTWRIPYGHSSDAWVKEPAFEALTSLIKGGQEQVTADDVNQTQMKELKQAVEKDGILETMRDAGFTFKEMMYTLTKMFPDAGINYDLSKQSTRNYSRVKDSNASGSLYKTMGEKILDYWKVGGTEIVKKDDSTNGKVEKYDPITFQSGDTTYTFITDRDGDGQFDYENGKNNDLLGSQDGIAELAAFDYNGDGVIDAKDVDKDGNKALDQLTLMANKQTESVGNKSDVEGYKGGANYKGKGAYTNSVDFGVTYTSASALGITQIDVSKFKAQGNTKGGEELTGNNARAEYDNVQEAYDDINGSSVINQFSIKTDGSHIAKNITGNETLNTAENLETFYGQVAKEAKGGKNSSKIYSSLTKAQVKSAFDNMTNADAIAAKAILDNVEAKLKDAQEYSGKPQDVTLNLEREDFEKFYGTDGTDGTYVKQVIKNGAEAAELYKTEKGDEVSENQDKAYDATGKAVDAYNESIRVGTGKQKVDTDDPYLR